MSDDMDLNQFLAEMAAMPPAQPSAALTARILADAAREQPGPAWRKAVLPPRTPAKTGWLAGLAGVFGGPGALAGIVAASVTGLYLGLAQPISLTSLTGLYSDTPLDQLDVLSGSDSLWTETTR